MTGYERPTERGSSPSKVSFWANIWWPDEHNSHGRSIVSPAFGTQMDLGGWVRAHRTEDCQVAAWKRTVRGADYVDESLSTREDPPADPVRFREFVKELTAMIDAKKRQLDRRA